MQIPCIAACIHSLILSLWKTICLCLPCTLPSGSNQGSFSSAFPSPGSTIPALTASLSLLRSHPDQPVSPCWAPSSTSASLFHWGAPNLGAQCSQCSLSSAQEQGRIAALSSTPGLSRLQLGFVVLVTTWWSCQDIFWTVQSLKITAEIVRLYLCKKEWQLMLFNPTQKIYLAKLSKFELYLT